ncbi:hypothetical protein [Lactiplantibacillus pentosus]|uniref:hypothetical protein n=1 Tax=Lactiplantibacillus pentosus TaxID=1589 RepID=UPI002182129C|nr:hypothetical protein [Lactiplantibacillus pentosus]
MTNIIDQYSCGFNGQIIDIALTSLQSLNHLLESPVFLPIQQAVESLSGRACPRYPAVIGLYRLRLHNEIY